MSDHNGRSSYFTERLGDASFSIFNVALPCSMYFNIMEHIRLIRTSILWSQTSKLNSSTYEQTEVNCIFVSGSKQPQECNKICVRSFLDPFTSVHFICTDFEHVVLNKE